MNEVFYIECLHKDTNHKFSIICWSKYYAAASVIHHTSSWAIFSEDDILEMNKDNHGLQPQIISSGIINKTAFCIKKVHFGEVMILN